ncbi:MAG: hypothetical protein Q9168_004676 [Polycauliona sp. 1 TL-2023]
MVFQHNEQPDLQNIRLACRDFNAVVIPLLYTELTVRLDLTDQEIARRPLFTFGRYVKVLKFLTVCYQDISLADYSEAIRGRCKEQKVPYDERLDEESYDECQRLAKEYKSAMGSGLISAYATSILDQTPNVECVLLGDGVCRPRPGGPPGERLMNYACLWDDHEPYAINAGSGLDGPMGLECWDLLTQAYLVTNTHVRKLGVSSSFLTDDLNHGLRPSMLNKPGPQLDRTLNFVANLTTIEFELNLDGSSPADSVALAHVLAQATRLEALELRVMSDDEGDLGVLLHNCVYPKLRICVLECFESDGEQLLRFLTGPERLTHLRLGCYSLQGWSTWQQLAPVLKDRLQFLQELSITDDDDLWVLCHGLIREYFFGEGPNPFKGDGLDTDLEDDFMERTKIMKSAMKKATASDEKMENMNSCDLADKNDNDSDDESDCDWSEWTMSERIKYRCSAFCDCWNHSPNRSPWHATASQDKQDPEEGHRYSVPAQPN